MSAVEPHPCTASTDSRPGDPDDGAALAVRPPAHYLDWSRAPGGSLPRYLVSVALVVLAWMLGGLVVLVPWLLAGGLPEAPVSRLLAVTASFGVGFLALPWLVRLILRRPAWSVVTGVSPGPVRHFAVGASICLVMSVLCELMLAPVAPLHSGDFEPSTWLPLAAVALLGFFVQAGFEELLFRGLLMQAVASRTSRVSVIIGAPALLFAAMHWDNLEGLGANPLQVLPYLLMGVTYGWSAWYTGSLWLPFGMHWANNLFATVAVTSVGDVLPNGAPFVRDLAGVSLETFTLMVALQCALQVAAVRWLIPRTVAQPRLKVGTNSRPEAVAGPV